MDLEIAVILSSLAYTDTPLLEVGRKFPYSTNEGYSRAVAELSEPECGLKYAEHAPHPYLMAVSKRHIIEAERKEGKAIQRTLWIGFPGTQDRWDILVDLTAYQGLAELGCIHAGFLKRSNAMPHDFFKEEFVRNKYDRMIFTGHSLGGAVAHICALKQLNNTSSQTGTQIYSIAFGTPFIGDNGLKDALHRRGLSDRFLTLVNEQDAVPGLLLLCMTADKLQPEAKSDTNLLDTLEKLAKLVAGVALGDVWSKIIVLAKAVLPQLKECIKSFFKYTPFGTYAFLQLDSLDKKMEPVTETTEIISRIKKILCDTKACEYSNVSDHSLINYVSSLYHSSTCTRVQPAPSIPSRGICALEKSCSPQIDHIDVVVDSLGKSLEIQITGAGVPCILGPEGDRWVSLTISDSNTIKDWKIQKSTKQYKWVARIKGLLPSHARITVGAHYIDLKTHFGNRPYPIESNNVQMGDERNDKIGTRFNANMLYASLLRACFAFLHDTENPDKQVATNKQLMAIRQLIQECNSESDSKRFTEIFLQSPTPMGELSYYKNFHQQMSPVILALYTSLVRDVTYKFVTGYLYSALCFGASIAAVAVIGSNPVGWAAAGVCTAGSLYLLRNTKKERQYYGVEKWAYNKHLAMIASFICVSTSKCTEEHMFEVEIIKKLDQCAVPEKIEDDYKIPEKLFTVKYRDLDKKQEALRFARQTTLIHGLRLSMNRRIYVTFVNTGTKNQLLNTLWKIPSSELPNAQAECYPLTGPKEEYELVILLLPTLTNLSDTMNKLKQYYTIEPKLCVVVSSAKDFQLRRLSIMDARCMSRQKLQSISKPAFLQLPIKQVTIVVGDRSVQEAVIQSDDICWADSLDIDNKETIMSFLNKHLRNATLNTIKNVRHYEYRAQSARFTT